MMRRQQLAPRQERQLDEEYARDDLAAEPLAQVAQRTGGAARRKQVVVDQDAGAARQRVGVDLEGVDPVFECVLGADDLVRQLAALARGHEAHAEVARQRAAEDEAARLGGDHEVDVELARVLAEPRDGRVERCGVQQERRDVLEDDPRLREVVDVPYERR
jgi:hypothetical protein